MKSIFSVNDITGYNKYNWLLNRIAFIHMPLDFANSYYDFIRYVECNDE